MTRLNELHPLKIPTSLPNPSWLTSGRTPGRQKLITTFQWIDTDIRQLPYQTLKVGCLPHAVGKQPSIPLINLGRKWLLK